MNLSDLFDQNIEAATNAKERRKIVTLWFQSVCETLHEHRIDTDAVRPKKTGDHVVRAVGFWRNQPYQDLIDLYWRLKSLKGRKASE
ncbi:hypothetical protein ASE85_03215 [Sphingobium sp. Leaf26]|nr:hypothetical protein ASE85_03215 [Sphingobium sp. Leaf26]